MNKARLLLVGLALMPFAANAADMSIMRGGFGFLYPDNNAVSSDGSGHGFTNSSMLANSMGTSIEALYTRQANGDASALQTGRPSVVYGNGKFGLGVFGNRWGDSLTTSGRFIDEAGVGLGVALVRDHLNLGVAYSRVISGSPPNSGDVKADLTLMGSKDRGASVGIGVNKTFGTKVGRNVVGTTAGVGYSFHKGTSVEANIHFNDMSVTDDYALQGFVNIASQMVYFSAGYEYQALPKTSDALGRLGFILSHNFDVSGIVKKNFVTGSNLEYGGSLRVTL